MRISRLIAGAACIAALAGCQGLPRGMTVAEYCADPDKAGEAVCQLNVEIDGQKTALAQTNMTLREARALAVDARGAADRAQARADEAHALANSASLREDELFCETRVIQQTDTGSCAPGYTLMSCTQTRYTYRAGGPSILREIDDKMCRFHDRVLEMRVRCCMAGANRLPTGTAADTTATGGGSQSQGASQARPKADPATQPPVEDPGLTSFLRR